MTIVAGLVMLGVLVVVHEFGHFVLAKLFNIGVPVFSVGMGPRLTGLVWRGTDYRLSLFPVGGYVRLAGADPFGEEDPDAWVDPEQDFTKKPIWQRLLVMLAGPAFNLILPFVLFTAVLMSGEPKPSNQIGTVLPGSVADQLGLVPGDRVVSVDAQPTEVWGDVEDHLLTASTRPSLDVLVNHAGQESHLVFPIATIPKDANGDPDPDAVGLSPYWSSTRIGIDDPASPAALAGLRTGDIIDEVDGTKVAHWRDLRERLDVPGTHAIVYRRVVGSDFETRSTNLAPDPAWAAPAGDPMGDAYGVLPVALFVGDVQPDSPAATMGVQPDDRIWSVDDTVVRSWFDLTRLVAGTAKDLADGESPRSLTLLVIRDGKRVPIALEPRMEVDVAGGTVSRRPVMGIHQYPKAFVPGEEVKKYYGITEAVPRAAHDTVFLVTSTVAMLGHIFTGQVPAKDSIGGPIEIFRMAGEGAERGIFSYIRLIGTISISLGIFNLLPVPVLDGGQILFYAIEGIRGRPLSLAVREKLQMAGVLALVALMLVVAVLDINRMVTAAPERR